MAALWVNLAARCSSRSNLQGIHKHWSIKKYKSNFSQSCICQHSHKDTRLHEEKAEREKRERERERERERDHIYDCRGCFVWWSTSPETSSNKTHCLLTFGFQPSKILHSPFQIFRDFSTPPWCPGTQKSSPTAQTRCVHNRSVQTLLTLVQRHVCSDHCLFRSALIPLPALISLAETEILPTVKRYPHPFQNDVRFLFILEQSHPKFHAFHHLCYSLLRQLLDSVLRGSSCPRSACTLVGCWCAASSATCWSAFPAAPFPRPSVASAPTDSCGNLGGETVFRKESNKQPSSTKHSFTFTLRLFFTNLVTLKKIIKTSLTYCMHRTRPHCRSLLSA